VISGNSAKDCYYVAVPHFSEKVYYASTAIKCTECISVVITQESERCFDVVGSQKCYKCISCVESTNCVDSSFLYDCKNCTNCFMSANLRNKQYYFKNEKLSKEEYQEKMKSINLGKRSIYEKLKKEFDELVDKKAIKKNVLQLKTTNCVGDNIFNSNNCYKSFDLFGDCENARYICGADNATESLDTYGTAGISSSYESTGLTKSNNIKFSIMCRDGLNLEYSAECNNCENCFACVGLKNKKFHIFNKPYSEEEYW